VNDVVKAMFGVFLFVICVLCLGQVLVSLFSCHVFYILHADYLYSDGLSDASIVYNIDIR